MLTGRVAIVTGASRGIGRAIATTFARHGASLALNYNSRDKDMDETIEALIAVNAEFTVFKGNVSDTGFVQGMVKDVKARYGSIAILVNNAGITRDKPLLFMSQRDWDEVIDINLKGAFLFSKAVLSTMMEQKWGRIINVSSITAISGRQGQTNYGAAKGGLIAFTKSMAQEVARYNVLVNVLAVGLIDTLMTKRIPREILEETKKSIPIGRIGRPEEVADVCAFLASDMSSYVSGTTITVSGGLGS
ncbi:MAG: 3-oxoacyl-(acyl-carrier-protein) reductase FabG [Syntrophorhabdus sp. PtaB.Bin184]|nr:MAG: 3-oxoacyl-(acyl-carrier-protein) reductase FabG [Syntrophorhabdus sp. PtaB.Bin184]